MVSQIKYKDELQSIYDGIADLWFISYRIMTLYFLAIDGAFVIARSHTSELIGPESNNSYSKCVS